MRQQKITLNLQLDETVAISTVCGRRVVEGAVRSIGLGNHEYKNESSSIDDENEKYFAKSVTQLLRLIRKCL
jgi:TFIIF-interacting CTD phosphatase-like protein